MSQVPTPDDPGDGIVDAVFGAGAASARVYARILATRGVEWGLLGPREVVRIWSRHLLNSVAIASLVGAGSRVVDVGSGAGLPGIPLALARTDLAVTLLEPLERRDEFLRSAVAELGLTPRVECRRGRAEDLRGEGWDVATCRAVAPLEGLLPWAGPLVAAGGLLLAVKGVSATEEVARCARQLRKARLTAEVLVVRAHPEAEPTRVVRVSKAA